MTPAEHIEHLKWCIEEMTVKAPELAPFLDIPELHLTGTEQRIMGLLLSRSPHTVTRDALLAAIAWDKPDLDDWPAIKIIDVKICQLRKKLRAVGDPVRISTAWGVGYRAIKMEEAA